MATAKLNNDPVSVVAERDSITIVDVVDTVRGGRTLDVTGVTDEVIESGHVIIKTAAGDYAPLGVASGAYSALPEGASYVGILINSIPTNRPFAGILIHGTVNPNACAIAPTEEAQTALSHIIFLAD